MFNDELSQLVLFGDDGASCCHRYPFMSSTKYQDFGSVHFTNSQLTRSQWSGSPADLDLRFKI